MVEPSNVQQQCGHCHSLCKFLKVSIKQNKTWKHLKKFKPSRSGWRHQVKVNRRANDSDGYSWKNISALSVMYWHVHSHRCYQLTCSSATESLSHWASSFVYHILNWNQTLPSSLPFVVWRTFNSTVNFVVDTSANRRLQMPKACSQHTN